MFTRNRIRDIVELLAEFPAVALLGPRQAGKTTLAIEVAKQHANALYLDLELPSAQRQIEDAEAFLLSRPRGLVILDEVQRAPELFSVLRGVIDQRRRTGHAVGQFLLLGSASGVLLRQASESLAGRIAQIELTPLLADEVLADDSTPGAHDALWLRGGFPLSCLAKTDASSLRWREAFITNYLERDIPALGPRIPTTTLRRLWTMLAHHQGGLLKLSQLAASLAVTGQTVARYIDLLCDLMLVRRLPAWHGNVGKRLVRAPKVYVRDPGLAHALLGIGDTDALLAHPIAGASWEAYIIENLIAAAPNADASFYRTSHGAEADLVLSFRSGERWLFEIKRSSAPTVSRGFHQAATDLEASRKIVVAPIRDRYPLPSGIEAMSPLNAIRLIASAS